MKFSENWLHEFVAINASREELAKSLTMAGLEVENIEIIGSALEGVVVGEIISAEQHPNADRLRVCGVKIGDDTTLQIVCGAPNARVGLKAPLAKIGTTMPNGMQIKQAALRNVESFGMLCSAVELGISPDTYGLLELPSDATVGLPIAKFLQLPDSCIEIKLTPNRPDCLGMVGLAREVAAQFGVTAKGVEFASIVSSHLEKISVVLDTPNDCPRYCGRVIRNIKLNAKTPFWMVEKLRRVGIRAIHPVVDITHFVMIELGQPMHGFDFNSLQGDLVVRRALKDEKLKLLDEREIDLNDEFLIVADAARPIALAGIMGGWDTRVTESTCNVFFEAAHFSPESIAGRARKLGLHTDASHRFERGVDPNLPLLAIERATALLVEIAGGEVGPITHANVIEKIPSRNTVRLRKNRLQQLLGLQVDDARVASIFESLGMKVVESDGFWDVIPPSSRFDIGIEEDLIEEVARIYGYNNVPTRAPRGSLTIGASTETVVPESQARRLLMSRGYDEALNFSFVSEELLTTWNLHEGSIALANPLSSDLGRMRTSLLPGLVEVVKRNIARQQDRVRFFEIGKSFVHGVSAPIETQRVAMVACGSAFSEQWSVDERMLDFYDLKGDVEQLLGLAGNQNLVSFQAVEMPYLHPGRSAQICRGDSRLGIVGSLHPRLQQALNLSCEVFVVELDLALILSRTIPRASEFSKFPSIRRDLAFVVPISTQWAELAVAAKFAGGEIVRESFVFDQFVGAGIEIGCKSLAMGLILQDTSRTLTVDDADRCVAAITEMLGRQFGANLRG